MSVFNGVMYAAPAPEGFTPDPNQAPDAAGLIGVSGVFFTLAVVTSGIRMYTRGVILGKLSMDDYVMVAALILSAIMLGYVLDMLHYGLGKDMWNVPLSPDLFPNFMFRNIVAAITFCLATGFAKGSILLFYLRIFPSKAMRWTVWVLFVFTVGYSVASAFVNVFSCNPIEGSWAAEYIATAVCIDRPVFYFVQAGLGIFTDVTTVVAPLPLLKSLRLPNKQKIGVAVVLTVGAFVCVVSVIRLKSLYTLLTDDNLTRNTENALMWCVLELNLSITGGNIPALKPFIQRIAPRLLGTSRNGASNSVGAYYGSHGGARRSTKGGGGGTDVSATDRAGKEEEDNNNAGGGQYSNYLSGTTTRGHTTTKIGSSERSAASDEFILMTDQHPRPGQGLGETEPQGITKTVVFGFEEHEVPQVSRQTS